MAVPAWTPRVPMAAEGSRPYLGSPRLAERHVPQASEPQTTEVGSRTPDLPLNQDACVPVPRAQAIALQVDMAMALERVDFAEQYGQSYLCLLQTVFIAGRHPAARAPPVAPAPDRLDSLLACRLLRPPS